MDLIDFILNVAALLLWMNWRSLYFDPLVRRTPVTLVGTLRPADPRRLRGWQLLIGVVLIVVLRGALYWMIASPAGWTPKLNLGLVVPAFRNDWFTSILLYSVLSLVRLSLIFYFWLMVLAVVNQSAGEVDPIQKLLRLHLGRLARWRWPWQLLLFPAVVLVLWLALAPLLVRLEVLNRAHSGWHLVAQGSLVAGTLLFTLKFLLPVILLLHLVNSYVYFGANPLWDFISTTAGNLLMPLRRLPLRLARFDFAPILEAGLILYLLHWAPRQILVVLARHNLTAWPQ